MQCFHWVSSFCAMLEIGSRGKRGQFVFSAVHVVSMCACLFVCKSRKKEICDNMCEKSLKCITFALSKFIDYRLDLRFVQSLYNHTAINVVQCMSTEGQVARQITEKYIRNFDHHFI